MTLMMSCRRCFSRYIRSGKEFADEEHRRAWLIRATINCSKIAAVIRVVPEKSSPAGGYSDYGTGGKNARFIMR